MSLSLNGIKKYLYIEDSILYNWNSVVGKVLSDSAFLKIFFPFDFYGKEYTDLSNKKFSLNAILTNKSQLSLVMNQKYTHSALSTRTEQILIGYPSIWEEICRRCEMEISKSTNDHLTVQLEKLIPIVIDKNSIDLQRFVISILSFDKASALATIILYSLLDGNISSNLEQLIYSSNPYKKQFEYLNITADEIGEPLGPHASIADYIKDFDIILSKYSKVLSHFTSINDNTFDNPLSYLYQNMVSCETYNSSRKCISISGTAGSGKHLLTQLLYLNLCYEIYKGNENRFAPFYINLNYYIDYSFKYSIEEAINVLKEKFKIFSDYCYTHTNRVPFIFIDGIKEYELYELNIDFYMNQLISSLKNIQLVISKEQYATINKSRKKSLPGFATGDFEFFINMHAYTIRHSNDEFIVDYSKIASLNQLSNEMLESLLKLNIKNIDLFQLKMLLPRLSSSSNLSDLYNQICTSYMDGDFENELSLAPEWAFNFEYTDKPLIHISSKLCSLLTSHESIINYFIAKYYVNKIRSGNANNIDSLELIMPSKINIMIAPLLNQIPANEEYLLKLVEQNYDKMTTLTKAEMIHWLGRVKNKGIRDRADVLLYSIYSKEMINSHDILSRNIYSYEIKTYLFLLREITISLIMLGHTDISDEYISKLIKNKLENELNRGFHLEYYDDKPFIPAYDTLDFTDDITVGERTLTVLIDKVENDILTKDFSPIFDLNFFTICSLLQARIENKTQTNFDIIVYIKKACGIIQWYLANKMNDAPSIFIEYLLMIYHDYNLYIESFSISNDTTSLVSNILSSYLTRRTSCNQKSSNIAGIESVQEHAYNSWLIGMMFLPDYYPGYSDYSKDTILNLLLLHILDGDSQEKNYYINAYNRNINGDENYNNLGIFLSRGSYTTFADTSKYHDIKNIWYEKNNINGKIAKEICVIQEIYQFISNSNMLEPSKLSTLELADMKSSIHTTVGKKIMQIVVGDA